MTFFQYFTVGPNSPPSTLGIANIVGMFNTRKFGRHRRGTVFVESVTNTMQNDGSMFVAVRFRTGVARLLRCKGGRDFSIYGFADFRKSLRKLAKAVK